jgi:hypothetical protein
MDRQCSPTGAERGAEATTGKGLISSSTRLFIKNINIFFEDLKFKTVLFE